MKQAVAFAAITLAVCTTAFAGEGEKRCTSAAEDCASKIREMMTGQMFLGVIFYDSETGIYVKSVVPGSPAEEAGVAAGDYIVALEGKDLSDGNVKTFKKIFHQAQKRGSLTLEVRRGESILTRTAVLREITEEQINRIIAAHMDAAHSDGKVSAATPDKTP